VLAGGVRLRLHHGLRFWLLSLRVMTGIRTATRLSAA
jgi:hypothetical protein